MILSGTFGGEFILSNFFFFVFCYIQDIVGRGEENSIQLESFFFDV